MPFYAKLNIQNPIPGYRMQYIHLKLRMFIAEYGITSWPLDCVSLLKTICDHGPLPLQLGFASKVSDRFDAVTQYAKSHHTYIIILNQNKFRYPFKSSRDRRMNFTIAHEIGHIALDHLSIPDEFKSPEDRKLEDLEADEFAGRLLLPEELVLSCNFVSIASVAKYYNVSNSALVKRLQYLGKLDLIKSKKIPVCKTCGNTETSYAAKYCRICGNTLAGNLDGISLTRYFDGIKLDKHGEAYECPSCGDNSGGFLNENCSKCGISLYNYCMKNLESRTTRKCNYPNPGNARYCEMCGTETYFYKKGFLHPWKEAQKQICENDSIPPID